MERGSRVKIVGVARLRNRSKVGVKTCGGGGGVLGRVSRETGGEKQQKATSRWAGGVDVSAEATPFHLTGFRCTPRQTKRKMKILSAAQNANRGGGEGTKTAIAKLDTKRACTRKQQRAAGSLPSPPPTHLLHPEGPGLEGYVVGDDHDLATLRVLWGAHHDVPGEHPDVVRANHAELLLQGAVGLQDELVGLEELRGGERGRAGGRRGAS